MTKPAPERDMMLNRGDKVTKIGGDYQFVGTVVAAFKKLSGKQRYVVEDDRGILHIFSDANLQLRWGIPICIAEDEI